MLEDDNLLLLETNNLQQSNIKSSADANLDADISSTLEADASVETQAEATLDLGAESGTEALAELSTEADPMDPHLADLDKVIKRYEEDDVAKELSEKHMALGEDPNGGIDKISASSYAHNTDEDNKDLKQLFEGYSSADRGEGGLPDSENRIINKWQGQLAAEEAVKNWNTLSEGAMDKFMKDNFSKVWTKYDQYDRGKIDLINAVPFIRDLLQVNAPVALPDVNPYEETDDNKKKEKPIDVDPIVEPDIEDVDKKLIKNDARNDDKKAQTVLQKDYNFEKMTKHNLQVKYQSGVDSKKKETKTNDKKDSKSGEKK